MSRLRALAEKLLHREHENEHGVNTVPKSVFTPAQKSGPSVNTLWPNENNNLGRENERVHVFIPLGREQMNTLEIGVACREHENEHAVNNRCRHCGETIDWRRGFGLAFADGAVAHLACDDVVEEELQRGAKAGRRR